MALTKFELTKNLTTMLNATPKKSSGLVALFFEEISSILEQGQQIQLSGFGNFNLRDKKERLGRNPKNGKSSIISARRVVTFHAGEKLKARIIKEYVPVEKPAEQSPAISSNTEKIKVVAKLKKLKTKPDTLKPQKTTVEVSRRTPN